MSSLLKIVAFLFPDGIDLNSASDDIKITAIEADPKILMKNSDLSLTFIKSILKKNPGIIKYCNHYILDYETWKSIINYDGRLIKYYSGKHTQELQEIAFDSRPSSVRFFNTTTAHNIAIKIIENYPKYIKCIKLTDNDIDLFEKMIEKDYTVVENCKSINYKWLYINPKVIRYIRYTTIEDQMFVAKRVPFMLKYVNDVYPDVQKYLIRLNANYYKIIGKYDLIPELANYCAQYFPIEFDFVPNINRIKTTKYTIDEYLGEEEIENLTIEEQIIAVRSNPNNFFEIKCGSPEVCYEGAIALLKNSYYNFVIPDIGIDGFIAIMDYIKRHNKPKPEIFLKDCETSLIEVCVRRPDLACLLDSDLYKNIIYTLLERSPKYIKYCNTNIEQIIYAIDKHSFKIYPFLKYKKLYDPELLDIIGINIIKYFDIQGELREELCDMGYIPTIKKVLSEHFAEYTVYPKIEIEKLPKLDKTIIEPEVLGCHENDNKDENMSATIKVEN